VTEQSDTTDESSLRSFKLWSSSVCQVSAQQSRYCMQSVLKRPLRFSRISFTEICNSNQLMEILKSPEYGSHTRWIKSLLFWQDLVPWSLLTYTIVPALYYRPSEKGRRVPSLRVSMSPNQRKQMLLSFDLFLHKSCIADATKFISFRFYSMEKHASFWHLQPLQDNTIILNRQKSLRVVSFVAFTSWKASLKISRPCNQDDLSNLTP